MSSETLTQMDLEKNVSSHEPPNSETLSPPVADGSDIKKPEAPQALDWDGPDDPENAQNWPFAKKAFHIYVLSALAMATTLGVASYSPAIGKVAEDFHVSHVAATVPLTLYVVGQALGPCLAAPVSETAGRKGIFLITSPIGLLFTMGAGFSQNFGSLCVLRFFSGLFSSPSLSVGGGIIVDILPPIHRSAATALWAGVALLGTGIGPVLTGFAVQNKGWRWSQWVFIFVTLAGWIPSLFTSESYKKIILARRAKRLQKSQPQDTTLEPSTTKDSVVKASLQKWSTTAKFFLTVTLFRPWAMLVQEPIVTSFSLYLAVVFSVLFSFFDAFPLVFSGVYGFRLGETGVSFLGVFIGIAIGIAIHIVVDRLTYRKKTLERQARGDFTTLPPEERLYPAMIGAPLVTIGMFWFGWSSRVSVHWISSEIATVVFAIGAMGVSAPCLQYLLDVYGPLYGASAVGANNLARYLAGAASPLYTTQMYKALGIGWAVSLLAFVTLALMPVPFVLFKYGEALRRRSRYRPVGGVKKPA